MEKRAVLITGSSKGLGRALALEFASQGYSVLLHGRDKVSLDELAKQITKLGSKAVIVTGDVTSEKTVEALAQEAKKEKIDILVNNAGAYLSKPVTEMSAEELRSVMEVNFFAQVILTKKVLTYFLEKGSGLIVNINSVAGKQGSLGEAAYSASKHALKGFSESLKFETTSKGVKVLDVYSGAIATAMTLGRKPQEQCIQPDEAAKVIVANCVNYKSLRIDEIDLNRAIYK